MIKKQSVYNKIIFWTIVVIVMCAPFTNDYAAYCGAEFIVFILLLFYFIDKIFISKIFAFVWVKTPVNPILILTLAAIGLQTIPIPISCVEFLSPNNFAEKMRLFDLTEKFSDSSAIAPKWLEIATYVNPMRIKWLQMASYIGIFFLTLNTINHKKHINILVYSIIISSIFGIIKDGCNIQKSFEYLLLALPLALGIALTKKKKQKRAQNNVIIVFVCLIFVMCALYVKIMRASLRDFFEMESLIGTILIAVAFLIYFFKMVRLWQKRRDSHALGIGAGVIAGMFCFGFCSLFDSMNQTLFIFLATIAGVGYAVVHRRGRGYNESFFYKVRKISLKAPIKVLTVSLIVIVFISVSTMAGRYCLAELKYPAKINNSKELKLENIKAAIACNSANAHYHFELAKYYMNDGSNKCDEQTIVSLKQAVRLNPIMGIYWRELGKCYAAKNRNAHKYLNKWLPIAEECFEIAIQCDPDDASMLFYAAKHWVWRSRLFSETEAIDKFQNLFQRSLKINPKQWKKAIDYIWQYYPDDDAIALGSIPANDDKLKSLALQRLAMK